MRAQSIIIMIVLLCDLSSLFGTKKKQADQSSHALLGFANICIIFAC